MKNIFAFMLSMSTVCSAFAQVFPVVDLNVSGKKDNRINFVILPDGYTSTELDEFVRNADSIRTNAFKFTPLKEYVNFFNAYCIRVPSAESGVNHPATATDITETIPVMVVDNYFGSRFDNGGIHRALVVGDYPAVVGVLASNIPDYDIALILSNTTIYGGTGGKFATGTMNAASVRIAVHELGHSFAGLADEYWPGYGSEKPNMTNDNAPASVKWKDWLGYKSVGIYPYGASGTASTWYRPHQDCMMRYLDTVLCPVCKQTFIDRIYSLVNPMDELSPDTAITLSYAGSTLPFSVELIKPIPNTFQIQWTLNGALIPFSDTFANITGSMLSTGLNELSIIATDTTELSRSYWPAKGYQFSAQWKIEKTATGIIHVSGGQANGKFFFSLFPNPAQDQAMLTYENFNAPSDATYRLLDINGKIVQEHKLTLVAGKGSIPIALKDLSKGIYFVQLVAKNIIVNQRLLLD